MRVEKLYKVLVLLMMIYMSLVLWEVSEDHKKDIKELKSISMIYEKGIEKLELMSDKISETNSYVQDLKDNGIDVYISD